MEGESFIINPALGSYPIPFSQNSFFSSSLATSPLPSFSEILRCSETGGLKRCGGQGDILSGCLGTFLAWASIYKSGIAKNLADEKIEEKRLTLVAAYGAALVARSCSREGFKRLGRSMLANDLIDEVGKAYEK